MKTIILAIDIQNQYITPGTPFHIQGIDASLKNAHAVMTAARENGVPVWHMRHEQEKNVFTKGTAAAENITHFQPLKNEPSFTKNMYSCFSSDEFLKKVTEEQPDEIVVIGYGSSMCCTCTIIDGIHRGFTFTLVEDATASRSFPHASEEEMHHSAINVLKQYAKVVVTNELIKTLNSEKEVSHRAVCS